MVSAWYMDKSDSDQRDEHKCNPQRPVSTAELQEKTGVLYFPVSAGRCRGHIAKTGVTVTPCLYRGRSISSAARLFVILEAS